MSLENTQTADTSTTAATVETVASTAAPATTAAVAPATVPDGFVAATELTSAREQMAAAQAELKKFKDAELTEAQRIQQERDEARTELERVRGEARQERITSIATRLGFADAADANHFLPKDAADIEAALSAVLASKPYLKVAEVVAPVITPTSPANPARSATSQPTFTKAQVADRAFWAANKPQIMQAMKEGRISG